MIALAIVGFVVLLVLCGVVIRHDVRRHKSMSPDYWNR